MQILSNFGFAMFNEASLDREMRSDERTSITKSNTWVKNKFNMWRLFAGLDSSVPLEEILCLIWLSCSRSSFTV